MQLGDFFEVKSEPASGETSELTLINRLFRLTVLAGAVKFEADTSELFVASGYPFIWRRDQTADFSFDMAPGAVRTPGRTLIRLRTAELGLITIGADTEPNRLAALDRPRSFFDFLRKEYEVNLLLDGDEAAPRRGQLGFGVNLATIDSDQERPVWLDPNRMAPVSGLVETLRRLKPETLRFDYEIGRNEGLAAVYFDLCRAVGAAPYFRVDAKRFSTADLDGLAEKLRPGLDRRAFETVYLEIDVQGFSDVSCDSAGVDQAAERIQALSDRFRRMVGNGKTLISGIDGVRALSNDRVMLFFENLFATAVHAVDYVGVSWLFPGPGGWATDASDVDSAAIFAYGAERLKRLARRLFSDIPDPLTKPIVLTSWRYFRASDDAARYETVDRLADGFYYATVLDALNGDACFRLQLMDLPALTRRNSAGALEEGIGALALRLTARQCATRIAWRVVRDEPLPGARSAGIPGLVEALDVPDATLSATRSTDRKRVYLILQNRHPKKRLYARVHFANLPDLRPVKARIIRAGTGGTIRRFFENAASPPTMKELDMQRYRLMDRVNLDIPPQSIVSMELCAE